MIRQHFINSLLIQQILNYPFSFHPVHSTNFEHKKECVLYYLSTLNKPLLETFTSTHTITKNLFYYFFPWSTIHAFNSQNKTTPIKRTKQNNSTLLYPLPPLPSPEALSSSGHTEQRRVETTTRCCSCSRLLLRRIRANGRVSCEVSSETEGTLS